MVKKVDAESGQVIIMNRLQGKVIAMANAPRFDNNTYASVYEKEPMILPPERRTRLSLRFSIPKQIPVCSKRICRFTSRRRAPCRPNCRRNWLNWKNVRSTGPLRGTTCLSENITHAKCFPTPYKGIWLRVQEQHRRRIVRQPHGAGNLRTRICHEACHHGHRHRPVGNRAGRHLPDDGPVIVDKFRSATRCTNITDSSAWSSVLITHSTPARKACPRSLAANCSTPS